MVALRWNNLLASFFFLAKQQKTTSPERKKKEVTKKAQSFPKKLPSSLFFVFARKKKGRAKEIRLCLAGKKSAKIGVEKKKQVMIPKISKPYGKCVGLTFSLGKMCSLVKRRFFIFINQNQRNILTLPSKILYQGTEKMVQFCFPESKFPQFWRIQYFLVSKEVSMPVLPNAGQLRK